MHVLLVDDSARVRARLAAMLGEIDGIFVREAGTVDQAREELREKSFQVVVLDLHLPGKNGMELLAELHEVAPECELIVLSNESSEQVRRACLERGATRFLDKSREFALLGSVVRELALARRS